MILSSHNFFRVQIIMHVITINNRGNKGSKTNYCNKPFPVPKDFPMPAKQDIEQKSDSWCKYGNMSFGVKAKTQSQRKTYCIQNFFLLNKLNALPGSKSDAGSKNGIHPHIVICKNICK